MARPITLPNDTSVRSIRLSDAEYNLVKEYVSALRRQVILTPVEFKDIKEQLDRIESRLG